MATVLDAPEADLIAEDLTVVPYRVPVRLPDKYEVVFGRILEPRPMSSYARTLANRLKQAVDRFLVANDLGTSEVENGFHIPLAEDEGRNRIPDWAFVSYERWPKDRPHPLTGNFRDVVPDIAAEVVSPTDPADELLVKVREYLRGGVRLVWVVYPAAREVHAYRPGVRDVRVYLADDELDAGDILPAFRTPVGPLFPPTEAPAVAG
jgi:Uma2 family endonuclease